MTEPTVPLDRTFGADDEQLMARRIAGLAGQPCVAWRKGYAGSGSLHYGALVPQEANSYKFVDKTAGTWIVSVWDCGRRLTMSDGTVLDSRELGDDDMLTSFAQLEGAFVQTIRFDAATLSLTIAHSNDILLRPRGGRSALPGGQAGVGFDLHSTVARRHGLRSCGKSRQRSLHRT